MFDDETRDEVRTALERTVDVGRVLESRKKLRQRLKELGLSGRKLERATSSLMAKAQRMRAKAQAKEARRDP